MAGAVKRVPGGKLPAAPDIFTRSSTPNPWPCRLAGSAGVSPSRNHETLMRADPLTAWGASRRASSQGDFSRASPQCVVKGSETVASASNRSSRCDWANRISNSFS